MERDLAPPKVWHYPDGSRVACTEKVKVLEENWSEARAMLQDILDDAVLMGCTVSEVKREYMRLVANLECAYMEHTPVKTEEEQKALAREEYARQA